MFYYAMLKISIFSFKTNRQMFKKVAFFTLIILSYAMLYLNGCKKADPVCENGGIPLDGSCSCQVGYSGANCETEMTPQYFEITNVSIVSYPTSIDGRAYDALNAPDPVFFVFENGGTKPLFTGATKLNVPTTEAVTWAGVFNLKPNIKYSFEMWDDDSGSYELMGSVATQDFWAEVKGQKFPNKVTLVNGKFKAELSVLYRF